MYKLCVFAGTSEGRRMVDFLKQQDSLITACVATEYGGELIEPAERLTVRSGRMDEPEMEELFKAEIFDLVIDATHPYASAVTENVMTACLNTQTEYLRLERGGEDAPESAVCVNDIPEAVEYLNGTIGNILLTTGSKELSAFSGVADFAERTFARVLPVESSITACREAGLKPAHILAMQGPFSVGMNAAMIKSVNAAYVVTKDSGKAGGFEEKALAAMKAGAKLVVIGRPESGAIGLSFSETLELLEKRYGFAAKPKVTVVGIGPGPRSGMTISANEAASKAECLIGAARMVSSARPDQTVFEAVSPDAIADFIRKHNEFSRFAVLMSGDVGFFSGAKKLLPMLDFCKVEVLPGISSLAYLSAKIGVSYEGVKNVSLHGRDGNVLPEVLRNRRVFALLGGENGAGRLIGALAGNGLGAVRVSVGERLGYPDEKISQGTADELAGLSFDALSCVLIENDSPQSAAAGLPDEAFIRNSDEKPVVPMTKSEVRAVAMSKLRLLSDSVCWDIGSGTGSCAVEMALAALKGRVYAIEKKPEACELIRDNTAAFGLKNIEVIEGSAPEICAELPAPTHAFIGGSSGNMRGIVGLLLEKNPRVRIVAAAIALETVSELTAVIKEFGFTETEVVSLSVAKARRAGAYSLMTGQNPVYIFTMQRT
ncbi:MAG: precorrin-6A reductase [Clostridiales bacterium]|nr:precorrin-6A reductase [Clostridiales bacterium]